MAEGIRLRRSPARVFVLMSDGECNEGSVWEAAMLAPARRLTNLCVIVDFNKWQATGRSREVMALDPLAEKWRSFGWDAVEVDGHDIGAVAAALGAPPGDRPRAVVAHTVKGAGISFMADDNNWHYRLCDVDTLERAFAELGVA
jgi:transketolase